jgi:DNA polymerase sigma
MTETKQPAVLDLLAPASPEDPLIEEIRLGIHKVAETAAREYILQLKEKAQVEALKVKESQEETQRILARLDEVSAKIATRNENLAKQNMLLDKITQELSK